MCEVEKKLEGTRLARLEAEKVWRELKAGEIVQMKNKSGIHSKEKFTIEKYKIIKKSNRTILMQKVRNSMKETFSFGDLISGDITI